MTAEVIRVTDDATWDDLVLALTNVNTRSMRIPHVMGSKKLPTEWDRRHEQIDKLLTDMKL